MWPEIPRSIPVKFDSVFVRIAQVERLAYTVITRAIERDSSRHQPPQRITERRTRGIQNREMKQTRAARRRRCSTGTFPRVETDMMMISASRDECRLRPEALHQLEAEHATIESERAIDIRHLQVHMADARLRVDCARY